MIDQIVVAFLGGLAASSAKVASKLVEDAYDHLKKLLTRELGEKSDAVEAISKLEAKPSSEGRKTMVVEELTTADIRNMPELLEAAQKLQKALEELPAEDRVYIQQAIGSNIAQASGGSIAKVHVNNKR